VRSNAGEEERRAGEVQDTTMTTWRKMQFN
jgi:hypothetical protein